MEHVDVLVVGAGISGISAGYYLQTRCPNKSYAILEGREALGGTWDLFRYPGIRSDSDMFTLGFSFRPWPEKESVAEGAAILDYLKDTADEYGIREKIRLGHRVHRASWSTQDSRWTVAVTEQATGTKKSFSCHFLFLCCGYYNYEKGHTPDFPGVETFEGPVIHPQHWPEDLDYKDKNIVVIGSGATAMTLVPSLAEKAAHVTMLQRSPTYVVNRPAIDPMVRGLRRVLPTSFVARMARWKNVLLTMYFYWISKRKPKQVRRFILNQIKKELGEDFDIHTHFSPRYNPWDQRVCLILNGDLFERIKEGTVSMVTDEIDTFTQRGIALRSGEELETDIVITATGLQMQFLGSIQLDVDGEVFDQTKSMVYLGAMFRDVPNLAMSVGYTNASWTLKCELICSYLCKILNYMDIHGYNQCVPRLHDDSVHEVPFSALSSGYVQRALHMFPKQGSKTPWRVHQNYLLDLMGFRWRSANDGTMEFSTQPKLSPTGDQ